MSIKESLGRKAEAAVRAIVDGADYFDIKENYGSLETTLAYGRLNKRRVEKEKRKIAVEKACEKVK